MRSLIHSLLLLLAFVSRFGLSSEERCHSPPPSDDSQRLLASELQASQSAESVTVLNNNLRRHTERVGLRDAVTSPWTLADRSVAPAVNYSLFPLVVYSGRGCRDSDGVLCSYCCNGACCEKVVDVPGDAAYNPPEVLNKTGGFDDISTTARLIVPVRIILIVREGASHRFTVTELDDQLAVVNRYFATSKLRFVAYSFERVVSNAMSDSCRTDPCYSDPTTCAFFQSTLPKFVRGATSAVDVMNVVVCTQITYLGEAQFPWTSVEASPTHYVQIQYGAWLSKTPASLYGLGMTMVHEIGHYFGALHTFEKEGVCDTDGDYVADTVPCKTYASITDPCDTRRNSCGQGFDDLANIMNYAADRCMQYFSRGQLLRMEQATLRYRQEFVRRHLVEAECPIGGVNNNLDSCVCGDGSNPATLCGVYKERLPITLFLPGSQRFNGELYNPPDAPPPPISQDPLVTPGILIAFVLAVIVSVSAFIGLLVLVFCWVAGDKDVPVRPRIESVPWPCLRLDRRSFPRREQHVSAAVRMPSRGGRDDTFSLNVSLPDNISQKPASRFELPSSDADLDREYSDASAHGERYSLSTKPAFHEADDEEWSAEEQWEEEEEEHQRVNEQGDICEEGEEEQHGDHEDEEHADVEEELEEDCGEEHHDEEEEDNEALEDEDPQSHLSEERADELEENLEEEGGGEEGDPLEEQVGEPGEIDGAEEVEEGEMAAEAVPEDEEIPEVDHEEDTDCIRDEEEEEEEVEDEVLRPEEEGHGAAEEDDDLR